MPVLPRLRHDSVFRRKDRARDVHAPVCDISNGKIVGIATVPARGLAAAMDLQGLPGTFAGHKRCDQKTVQMA